MNKSIAVGSTLQRVYEENAYLPKYFLQFLLSILTNNPKAVTFTLKHDCYFSYSKIGYISTVDVIIENLHCIEPNN